MPAMSEEVQKCVAKRMRQPPTYSRAMTEGDSTSEELEQPATRRKKQLKSGMDRTGATMVVRQLPWPHKLVYTVVRKSEAYQDISIPLFVQGYLVIMEGEEGAIRQRMASHLEELMSDAELYGWECTRTFHGIWLNQLEQGRCTWIDDEKVGFPLALVW